MQPGKGKQFCLWDLHARGGSLPAPPRTGVLGHMVAHNLEKDFQALARSAILDTGNGKVSSEAASCSKDEGTTRHRTAKLL